MSATLEAAVLADVLHSTRRLLGEVQDRVEDLESQKRSLLATNADLQALVRLLSQNKLKVA